MVSKRSTPRPATGAAISKERRCPSPRWLLRIIDFNGRCGVSRRKATLPPPGDSILRPAPEVSLFRGRGPNKAIARHTARDSQQRTAFDPCNPLNRSSGLLRGRQLMKTRSYTPWPGRRKMRARRSSCAQEAPLDHLAFKHGKPEQQRRQHRQPFHAGSDPSSAPEH